MAGCRTRVTVGKVEHGKLLFAVTSYFHNDNVYLFRITLFLFAIKEVFSNHPVPLSKEGVFFESLRLPFQRELHFLPKPLFLRKRGCNRPTRCSAPLRSKVGGPSKVYARLCGMGPPWCFTEGIEGVGIVEVCRCHYVYHAGGIWYACLSAYRSSE